LIEFICLVEVEVVVVEVAVKIVKSLDGFNFKTNLFRLFSVINLSKIVPSFGNLERLNIGPISNISSFKFSHLILKQSSRIKIIYNLRNKLFFFVKKITSIDLI